MKGLATQLWGLLKDRLECIVACSTRVAVLRRHVARWLFAKGRRLPFLPAVEMLEPRRVFSTTVGLSTSSYSVGDADGSALICVVLGGDSISVTVTVDFSTSNGTAISGLDYGGISSTTLTFAPGGGNTLNEYIPIHDEADNKDGSDDAEAFTVSLSNPQPSPQVVVGTSPGTVTILALAATDDKTPATGQAASVDPVQGTKVPIGLLDLNPETGQNGLSVPLTPDYQTGPCGCDLSAAYAFAGAVGSFLGSQVAPWATRVRSPHSCKARATPIRSSSSSVP